MAAVFDPPFHSSRQDQANYRMGDPHFSYASIGDGDAATPGARRMAYIGYVAGVPYIWSVQILPPNEFVITMDTPVPITLFSLNPSIGGSIFPSMLFQDGTETNADFVGSIVTNGGVFIGKNIRTPQDVQSRSQTLAYNTCLCTDKVDRITTPGNAPTPALAYTTANNTAYHIEVIVTASKAADGSTAAFYFHYMCKNIAGVVANSAAMLTSSAIDAGLAGISVGTGLVGTATAAVVTGLAATPIQWGVRMKTTSVPV
jgi:hypothetical protein